MNAIVHRYTGVLRLGMISIVSSSLLASAVLSQQMPTESKAERDARMVWWRDARFGMFIHWGVYAIPARGEWVMYNEKIPIQEYEKFPPQFNPVKFNAKEWVQIAKSAGVRYIVITSKHHDGFSMWDATVSSYDVIDATPFKRDPLKELADACKDSGIRLCFYYSIMDWHHPDARGERFPVYRDNYMRPELRELVTRYHPAVLWFDGQWIGEWDEDQGRQLYAELHALDPDLIMNNRIGKGRNDLLGVNTGGAMVGDFGTPEQYIPASELNGLDWESCMTMNDHWGYAAKDSNWKSATMLVQNLEDIASKGGNYLLNVGPTALGEIPAESVKRLGRIGEWLKVNGESIYGTSGSPFESTPWGRSTLKPLPGGRNRLYLHLFEWPKNGMLALAGLGSLPERATLLAAVPKQLSVRNAGDTVTIVLPAAPSDSLPSVVALDFAGKVLTYVRPAFHEMSSMILDQKEVSLSVTSSELEIRYTLDGSEPTKTSLRYTRPITLRSNTVLKARTYHRGKGVSDIVEKEFSVVQPRSSVFLEEVAPGLAYDYYEGDWKNLPDFDTMKALAAGTTARIGIEMRKRDERFGVRLRGFLTVPQDGIYLLALTSDDGSRLFIGKELVVDNDSLHSAVTKQQYVALEKGAHPVTIEYFNGLWEGELGFRIAKEGEPLRPVSASQLFHLP